MALELQQKLRHDIEEQVRVTLGEEFQVSFFDIRPGSAHIIIGVATAMYAIYMAFSRYKSFVDSLNLLTSQVKDIVSRILGQSPIGGDALNVRGTWTPGPSIVTAGHTLAPSGEDVSAPEKPQETNNSRWWEYYAVRYALGVGIGTPLIGLLWQQYHPLIPLSIKITSPFDSTISALLWGAGGMAFCYVASVPMLTFHSTRRALTNSPASRTTLFGCAILSVLIGIVFDLCFLNSILALKIAATIMLVITFSLQLYFLWKVLSEVKETQIFYDDLQKTRAQRPGIVESYRHMREHGNSVSIVLCEVLLAFCLWVLKPTAVGEASAIARVCLIIGIWLLPSSLVWLVGSSLERHVSRWTEPQTNLSPDVASDSPQTGVSRH
jgi:hypothetical protein